MRRLEVYFYSYMLLILIRKFLETGIDGYILKPKNGVATCQVGLYIKEVSVNFVGRLLLHPGGLFRKKISSVLFPEPKKDPANFIDMIRSLCQFSN